MNLPAASPNPLTGRSKKVFITGGTGFIGSHLLKQFASTEHELLAVRRENAHPRIDIGREPQWLTKPLDELDTADLTGVEVLVHLASVGVSPKRASWQELFYWNVSVFVRLLEQAKLAGIKRLVVAGTFAEYGRSADAYEFIPPDAPLLPTYAYAASKAAAFQAAMGFAVQEHIELCYLRIFSAFGDGQFADNFWPALKRAAESGSDFPMTAGEQVRDYVPVEDVAAQFLKAVGRTDVVPGIPHTRNVASGVPVTMRQFAEHWWHKWNARGKLLFGALPYRPNEVMRFVPLVEVEE